MAYKVIDAIDPEIMEALNTEYTGPKYEDWAMDLWASEVEDLEYTVGVEGEEDFIWNGIVEIVD